MSGGRILVEAPAKVNLSLAVLGQRPDGYHEVETVLLALDLCDRLELALDEEGERDGLRLELCGPAAGGVPADESNLAARAALSVLELARSRGQRPGPLRLRLEKEIPAGAGLGGASSDAAAAALGAALLLGLDPGEGALVERLARLGSDCPFFFVARASGLARCTGRGERVEPLAPPAFPWTVARVPPESSGSTAQVYGAFSAQREGARRPGFEPARFARAALAEARAQLVNDLEPAALRVHPRLEGLRALLEEGGPHGFRLAGSGSSFFALFADERAARAVLERARVRAEERRYALRGGWVLRARGAGVRVRPSSSQFGEATPACIS